MLPKSKHKPIRKFTHEAYSKNLLIFFFGNRFSDQKLTMVSKITVSTEIQKIYQCAQFKDENTSSRAESTIQTRHI